MQHTIVTLAKKAMLYLWGNPHCTYFRLWGFGYRVNYKTKEGIQAFDKVKADAAYILFLRRCSVTGAPSSPHREISITKSPKSGTVRLIDNFRGGILRRVLHKA